MDVIYNLGLRCIGCKVSLEMYRVVVYTIRDLSQSSNQPERLGGIVMVLHSRVTHRSLDYAKPRLRGR